LSSLSTYCSGVISNAQFISYNHFTGRNRQYTYIDNWQLGGSDVMRHTRGLTSCYQSFAPMADIAVALPVFTYGQNWRYYLLIINLIFADNVRIVIRYSCICDMFFVYLYILDRELFCFIFLLISSCIVISVHILFWCNY
jgi:hypothetical protein